MTEQPAHWSRPELPLLDQVVIAHAWFSERPTVPVFVGSPERELLSFFAMRDATQYAAGGFGG